MKTDFGITTSVEDQMTRPSAGTGVLESTSKDDFAILWGLTEGTGFPTVDGRRSTGISTSSFGDLTGTVEMSTSESVSPCPEPDAFCVTWLGSVGSPVEVD